MKHHSILASMGVTFTAILGILGLVKPDTIVVFVLSIFAMGYWYRGWELEESKIRLREIEKKMR